MKALVLCGGLPQIALIEELKIRGITTVLADMNEKVAAREYADKFYNISVFDIEALKKVAIKEKVDFAITVCADQVLEVVAKIADELGFPWYIDAATAENVSKKSYMKKIFSENDIPTTPFVILETLAQEKIAHLGYPIIVKPVDSYSSRGVCKVENYDELKSAFEAALGYSREKKVIVEEFAQGNEISVDVYVEEGVAHVLCMSDLYKIGENGKFVINRSCVPAEVSENVALQIADVAQKIANAFNLKNSPMLIQLISDGKKISVVEFCARTGGGEKFLIVKKMSGFDVIKAVVDLTLGIKPHVEEVKVEQKPTVNEFVYCKSGEYDHLEGFEELLSTGIITEYSSLKSKGTVFNEIKSSGDRVAYFSIESDSFDDVKTRHKIVNEKIRAVSTDGQDLIRHDLIEKYHS